MFPSVMIFILLLSPAVDILVYSQGHIAKKKAAPKISAIAVANSLWERLITFKRTIISMASCCFTPGSSFGYSLKVCSNKNDNDPSGSLLGSSLKDALKT